MKDKSVWFGYLEAGSKSSPVARDPQLETTKSTTMYLYNLNRQEFIEYNREIVEPKLREFTPAEAELCKQLETAFKKARKNFKGSGGINLAKTAPAPAATPRKEMVEETMEIGDGDDDIFDDSDWDSDD